MGQTSLATSGSVRPPKFPDMGPGSNTATTGQGLPGNFVSDPTQAAQGTALLSGSGGMGWQPGGGQPGGPPGAQPPEMFLGAPGSPGAPGAPGAPGSAGRPQDFSIVRGRTDYGSGIYGLTKQERGATGFQQNQDRPYFLDNQGRKWIEDGGTWQREDSPLAFSDQGVEGVDWVKHNRGVVMSRGGSNIQNFRRGLRGTYGREKGNQIFGEKLQMTRAAEQMGASPEIQDFLMYQMGVLLPGGIVASYGPGGHIFEDLQGRRIPGTPELEAASNAEHARVFGTGGGATDRPALNYGPANLTGLPGVPRPGVPGGASGLLAMPPGASPSGTGQQVVLAEAGEPEIAIPVSKLLAEVGPDTAMQLIRAVSHTVVGGGGGGDGTGRTAPPLASGGLVNPRTFNPGRFDDESEFVPPKYVYTGEGGGPRGNYQSVGFGPRSPQQSPPGAASASTFDPNQIYSFPDSGGGYSPFSGWTPASYQAYKPQAMPQDERAQLQAVTEIARLLGQQGQGLYNIGAPAYADAIKYYQTLLGGNRAAMQSATASTQEAIRQQGKGAESRLRSSLGRSGAADQAIADQARQEAGAIAEITRGVQPAAAAALQSGGLQGAQLGQAGEQAEAGLRGQVQGAMAQNRQFETGLGESSRQFGAGLTESSRQFGTQLQEQSRQFAAGLAEQVRQGNMSYSQAMAGLALQGKMFDQQFGLQGKQFDEMVREFNANLGLQKDQLRYSQKRDLGSGIGSLLGMALGPGGLIGKKVFGK